MNKRIEALRQLYSAGQIDDAAFEHALAQELQQVSPSPSPRWHWRPDPGFWALMSFAIATPSLVLIVMQPAGYGWNHPLVGIPELLGLVGGFSGLLIFGMWWAIKLGEKLDG